LLQKKDIDKLNKKKEDKEDSAFESIKPKGMAKGKQKGKEEEEEE
jgi:hypothetical protein